MMVVEGCLHNITPDVLSPIQINNTNDKYNCGIYNSDQTLSEIRIKLLQNGINIDNMLNGIHSAVFDINFVSHVWEQLFAPSYKKLIFVSIRVTKSNDNIYIESYIMTAIQDVPIVCEPSYKCRCIYFPLMYLFGLNDDECSICEDIRELNYTEMNMIHDRLMKAFNNHQNMNKN
jgi:hypothetical protein